MEKIIVGFVFLPFILVAIYHTLSVLIMTFAVVWVDALSAIGLDWPRQYLKDKFNF